MKKLFKATFAIALSSMLLFSCSKSENVTAPDDDNLVQVTIIAGNPQVNPGTKTEINGTTPYWSPGDAIGVSNGTSSNNKFETDLKTASTTASFTGTTVSGELYAYSPYSVNGVSEVASVSVTGAKVDIPTNQNPTVSSFDGSADIMVSKKFIVSPENTEVLGLQFKRLSAVVKVVLVDNTTGSKLASQHPSFVSLETSDENLTGRAVVDMVNQSLSEIYYNGSKKVTANYSSSPFVINGENAAYLIVYPRTLAAGTKLTVSASTEGFAINKEITIPDGGIKLEAGKITTLKVKIPDAAVTASSSGLALPFIDDTEWANNGSSDNTTTLKDTDLPNNSSDQAMYSAVSYCYKGAGGLKFGNASNRGSITTSELDLSNAFYIEVHAKTYGSDVSSVVFNVDGEEVYGSPTLTSAYGVYACSVDGATSKSKVEILIDGVRGYVNYIKIAEGTAPPIIRVTSNNPMSVANTAANHTINYNIDNPVGSGSFTATTTDTWISNIVTTTSGKVTFDVAAQASGAEMRSGKITLKYTNADDVEVAINQEAGPGGPGSSADNPFTASQARAAALGGSTEEVYVNGIISEIVVAYNSKFNNVSFNISDNGLTSSDQFEIFRASATSANDFKVGDYVLFKGNLKLYNSTAELDEGNELITQIHAPTFTPDGGNFTDEYKDITITSDEGAKIYYTTDGSNPTTSSLEYNSQIRISETTTIKAIAVKNGKATGVISKTFTKSTVTVATINFGNATGSTAINKSSVTGKDSEGNTWTITTTGTTSYTQSTSYSQVGKSAEPATSITFTTTLPSSKKINTFSAKFGGFSNTAGTVALKVGDTQVGTGSLNGTSDVTVTSSTTANGTVLTVTVTNIAKGVKVYNISYTY